MRFEKGRDRVPPSVQDYQSFLLAFDTIEFHFCPGRFYAGCKYHVCYGQGLKYLLEILQQ